MTKTGLEFRNRGSARTVGSPSEARTILVIVICYLRLITLTLQGLLVDYQLCCKG
jgi:hypothetical protein